MDDLQALVLSLRKEIELRSGDMAAGRVASFEEYKHMSGVIYGLHLAIEEAKALQQAKEDNDE